jgi:uncharacterized membrane protein YtjA (UPF0391 family)
MGLFQWAMMALIVSLVTGALSFTGSANGTGTLARVLSGACLAIAVVLFVLIVLGVSVPLPEPG